jgi:hypothetical protein
LPPAELERPFPYTAEHDRAAYREVALEDYKPEGGAAG